MTTFRPSPIAVRRHCLACAVDWTGTDAACWCCGKPGAPGSYPHVVSRPFETYTGQAPTGMGAQR